MPEMDGLTLLTKLNELYPIIKAVIISAYSDIENIRTAMNRGAFDFLTKPLNLQDLTITTNKTLQHVQMKAAGTGTHGKLRIIDPSATRGHSASAGGRRIA